MSHASMLGVCRASPASGASSKEDALEAVSLCLMLPLGLQWDNVRLDRREAGKACRHTIR